MNNPLSLREEARLPRRREGGSSPKRAPHTLTSPLFAERLKRVEALLNEHTALDEEGDAHPAPRMPVRVKDELGFILHRWDWSESSLLLDVLTENYGRVFIVAKGAKRASAQYRGLLSPFCPLSFTWTGKTEAKQLVRVAWRGSLVPLTGEALLAGFYINELILKLSERESRVAGLFARYTRAIYHLAQEEDQGVARHLRRFEYDLLRLSGWLPGTTDPIDPTQTYRLDGGMFVPCRADDASHPLGVCPGRVVLALNQGTFDNPTDQPYYRDFLKHILNHHLGRKRIHARQVMADLFSLSKGRLPETPSKEKPTMTSSTLTTVVPTTLGPVCVDIEGTTLTDKERARLQHPLTGMVILFSRNYTDPEQLKALTADIHDTRPGILIAVDHEGGRVQRFREGFTEVPAMADLRDAPHAQVLLEAAGLVLAAELRECGVDLTFAPVLDVDYGRSGVIGNRSLGKTPFEVTDNARALISGLRQGGMTSCGKHFPGHGWAEADSHVALPTDERDADTLYLDMRPYRKLPEMDSIMTAHVSYSAYDGELATFSSRLLKDVLRDKLGFKGLVFSDDLTMKGAGDESITTRAERALTAGCDMVLVCNAPELADELLATLSWSPTEQFAKRFSRLNPGTPVSWRLVKAARALLDDFKASQKR